MRLSDFKEMIDRQPAFSRIEVKKGKVLRFDKYGNKLKRYQETAVDGTTY